MVNKMKARLVLFVFLMISYYGIANAQMQPISTRQVYAEPMYQYNTQKKRTYIEDMIFRNKVRCGSNLSVKSFAHKTDGVWSGIDADMCRVIAQAILGDNEKIEMVNVVPKDAAKALDEGKIDVMLSGAAYSAKMETSKQALSAGLLYYDHQMLMVRTEEEAGTEDLNNYRGKKICISTDSDYYKNFDDYNMRYNLGITYLTFNNLEKAKEAFMLKRCQIMTASGLMLNGILKDLPSPKVRILPTQIAMHPVYAFVQKDNTELRLALKWIFNALWLAEQYDINANNLSFYATNDNPEIRNLLGDEEELWNDMKLNPQWVRKIVSTLGNYGDIFDRNLGVDSEYHLDRTEGRLVKDGGTIYPIPFM